MTDTPFYIPPEWAPHSAIWVGWPHLRGEWGSAFDGARDEIARFIRAMAEVTPVRVACGSREAYGSARFALEPLIDAERVNLHPLPAGDIWLRDTGPLISVETDTLSANMFRFNGWGGKYQMSGDTMTAGGIASAENLPRRQYDFVLEGGGIDLDGAGRLLTTKQCLLNRNRNPGWNEEIAEQILKQTFNVDQILWLDEGLLNDHTDGHVDNIARFIGPGRVLCQRASGEDDPNAKTLLAIEQKLSALGLVVETIPSPGRIEDEDGAPMPASHMNFVISNRHIFLPKYETHYAQQAIATLRDLMPGYEIIDLPARSILAGGGAFHCMTQQVPALKEQTV